MNSLPARFAVGQRVRVIANAGGLYAAQIGVVGVITKQRQKRRYGYRSYDVTYMKPFSLPNEKGREKIVIVREDDMEVVADAADAAIPEQLADSPAAAAALFLIGQRVTVHPPVDGLEDEYPSFTRYPVVGEIASACQVTHGGVHCYDVRFPRIEGGVSTDGWPPVSIREAHLVPEPSRVGWLAQAEAIARRKASAKAPAQLQPKFSVGEHVSVDPQSALAYETWTRKGAVGKIIAVGKPMRDIRRYDVRYETTQLGVKVSRIREAHLIRAEAPAPHTYTTARHAHEYREEKQRAGERLWCDAGGCFIEACAVCQQHPAPTLIPPQPTPIAASEMPYSTAALVALAASDPYEFALTLVRENLERGVWRDAILAWQTDRQWIHSVDGGTCYDVTRGGFYLTMLNGQKCSIRYALKTLVADVERRIAGVPQQTSLWGSETQA